MPLGSKAEAAPWFLFLSIRADEAVAVPVRHPLCTLLCIAACTCRNSFYSQLLLLLLDALLAVPPFAAPRPSELSQQLLAPQELCPACPEFHRQQPVPKAHYEFQVFELAICTSQPSKSLGLST